MFPYLSITGTQIVNYTKGGLSKWNADSRYYLSLHDLSPDQADHYSLGDLDTYKQQTEAAMIRATLWYGNTLNIPSEVYELTKICL